MAKLDLNNQTTILLLGDPLIDILFSKANLT